MLPDADNPSRIHTIGSDQDCLGSSPPVYLVNLSSIGRPARAERLRELINLFKAGQNYPAPWFDRVQESHSAVHPTSKEVSKKGICRGVGNGSYLVSDTGGAVNLLRCGSYR